jgi:hypothetical protein
MKIARFWEKGSARAIAGDGKYFEIVAWGWSSENPGDARRRATEAAERTARRFEAGDVQRRSYGYGDRIPREEILEEFRDDAGETVATITRNGYGSLVLNTRDLMFIDVDVPRESWFADVSRGIKRLFGITAPDQAALQEERIRSAAQAYFKYTFRVYRTAAGFRCIVVDRAMDSTGVVSLRMLERFGADPLYVRLCKNQECFRARLTPKFWRCGAPRPPGRYPWTSASGEAAYRSWESDYRSKTGGYATCRFISRIGTGRDSPGLQRLIELHDVLTGVGSDRPLA